MWFEGGDMNEWTVLAIGDPLSLYSFVFVLFTIPCI